MIVRTDLPVEHQLVQACHAAYEAGLRLAQPTKETDYSVICAVSSEQELRAVHARLEAQGIPTVLFTESDMDDQATAIGSAPVSGDQRRAFQDLPLWKPDTCLA